MKSVRNVLNMLLSILAGGSFLVMVVLTCWQVFTRYILDNPSSWSEELVSYMFAWMSLFGACVVTGERGHMNIPLLVEHSNGGAKKALMCLSEMVAFLFSAIILVFGGVQIQNLTMGQMTSSLGVPLGVFYVVVPVAGALNVIYTILNIVEILQGKLEKEAV